MRTWTQCIGFWLPVAVLGAGCASLPTTAVVNGVELPRPTREFQGQPYSLRHTGAHPQPGGPSSGLRSYGGKITGQVCGMDVDYEVQHEGDHIQMVGFIDNTSSTQLQVRDGGGERRITGSLANYAVDVHLRSNQIIGSVGFRFFDMQQDGDRLHGPLKMSGTDEPNTATANGRDALWAMPAADQAVVLANILTCYVATIGSYGRSPLVVGFGGKLGSLPRESSALYSDGAANGTDPSFSQGRAAGIAPRK